MEEDRKTMDKIDPNIFEKPMLLGRKIGMTQVFDDDGNCTPVTAIEIGPCIVVQVKSAEIDGYDAVQVGFTHKVNNVKKPQQGHFEKAGVEPLHHLREIRLKTGDHNLQPGMGITADIFENIKKVDISGTSKGKGFAGTIKRWHFKMGPASHGSMNVRQPGAIGQSASPSRVFKGVHMAGHLGAKRATCRNLKLVKVDAQNNTLLVKGAVPGHKGALLEIAAALIKMKKNS